MKNKTLIWVIFIFSILGIIAFILFRSNIPKRLIVKLNERYLTEELVSKRKYDSISQIRKVDSVSYVKAINSKDGEIAIIKKQLDIQKQKTYYYEKELDNYRSRDFDERFELFADLIRENHLPR